MSKPRSQTLRQARCLRTGTAVREAASKADEQDYATAIAIAALLPSVAARLRRPVAQPPAVLSTLCTESLQ